MAEPAKKTEPDEKQTQREVPNPWVLKADHNPYLHNIFVLLGIDPDGTQKSYDRAIDRWRQKVPTTKTTIFGHEVTDLDVARATHLARQETDFVAERLLSHTVHELDSSAFKEGMEAIKNIPLPKKQDVFPLKIRDLSFLAERLPETQVDLVESQSSFPEELLPELLAPDSAAEDFFEY